MSDATADKIGLPCFEFEVSCGGFCYGGTVSQAPATYLEHTRAADVWVRGDVVLGEVDRLRALLRDMVELAEYWINREDRRQFSEQEYRTWRALGHDSNAMKAARAALAKEGQ